ncbi:MAG TPA: hypothetical protein DEP18_00525 [Flavobacteriales bacterium]|nr:hypothetical protein [Flavobacteriales bacterium]HRE73791.1 hypothetical protein [Flavobacteriales bacterium]HRE95689.1 hypothetical protein [Flavobacteriales bacterium]HRJ39161.1 hypothetical protein [Flavobacteriales bacterium]
MKKDIEIPRMQDVGVAVVSEVNEEGLNEWNVYLINLKKEQLKGVLVSSRGYGEINNDIRKTSELRHFLDEVNPKSFMKIEPIIEDVFMLNNEYWVSFFLEEKMYDKKFIFLPETIREENLIRIPLIDKMGVMIL